MNVNSINADNHNFGRPVHAGDNSNTTGGLLDSTRPRKSKPRQGAPTHKARSPLEGVDNAVAKIAPKDKQSLFADGHQRSQGNQQRQPAQQQSGPSAREERLAYKRNQAMDEHERSIKDAQGAVDRMSTMDRVRQKSGTRDWLHDLGHEVQVRRPGVGFDQDGNGYGPAGAMVHRQPGDPWTPPAAVRRTPPDDGMSPAMARRTPKEPGPLSGAAGQIFEAIESSV